MSSCYGFTLSLFGSAGDDINAWRQLFMLSQCIAYFNAYQINGARERGVEMATKNNKWKDYERRFTLWGRNCVHFHVFLKREQQQNKWLNNNERIKMYYSDLVGKAGMKNHHDLI